MSRLDVLERALDRERRARKQAEEILESKSRELFMVNEQLRATAAELQTQISRHDLLVDEALDGIITVWSDNSIELFNPEAQRLFGYTFDEVRGRDIRELGLTHPNEKRRLHYEAGMRHHLKQVGHRELLGKHCDGSAFWLELSAKPVSLGGREALTMIVRDISQRRKLEEQLRHAQKMESVGQLAAGVAHEINTPIQYVGHNTRFLKASFGDLMRLLDSWGSLGRLVEASGDSAMTAALESIREVELSADVEFLREEIPPALDQSLEGTHRVASIVAAMKRYSHPGERGKQASNLNEAVESTVLVTRNEWKYVARMELDLSPDLPEVQCLIDEVNQVLVNLVVNASHAVAARHSTAETGLIQISTRPVERGVLISVRDNGSGIPEHVRPNIFDPFFTTKSLGIGTGQGLALAYGVIVEQHAGTIDFVTQENVGTVFDVFLPVASGEGLRPRAMSEASL